MSKFEEKFAQISTLETCKKQTSYPYITLVARGLEELFSSCAVVSVFWFLAGNRFWCYLFTYLEYNTVVAGCGIVLVFWFWWEIVFCFTYVLSVQYSCAVVSIFWLWQEIVLWREIVLKLRTPLISYEQFL